MENLLDTKFPYADNILKGKTALVCGASKGIGRATALMLARAGAQVIACARSPNELELLSEEMHGDNHIILTLDLENNVTPLR
jgi:3-oxoacyl-[acyl-carrier protein] reductase